MSLLMKKEKGFEEDKVKSPQMKKSTSGGSVFKNPKLSDSVLSRIRKRPRIQDITNRKETKERSKWKNTLQRKVTGSFRRRALKQMSDYSWGVSPGVSGRSIFSPPSSPSPKASPSATTSSSASSSAPAFFLAPATVMETPIRRPGRKRRPAPPPPVQVEKGKTPTASANRIKVQTVQKVLQKEK